MEFLDSFFSCQMHFESSVSLPLSRNDFENIYTLCIEIRSDSVKVDNCVTQLYLQGAPACSP